MKEKKRSLTESKKFLKRAKNVLPGQSCCYSRAPISFARGSYPFFIESGKGCMLTDVDGNKYIDTTMALCPVILGYSHPNTKKAIRTHANRGPLFTLPHRIEVELAEKLVSLIPCAERVRFGKNGADATSAAVRVAREFTGRDHIAICGYHGWHDWYISTTDQDGGIPKIIGTFSHKFNYNDLSSLKEVFTKFPGKIACVIMEPMSIEFPKEGFLAKVKELAHANGAVLIFDEIVTGFRWDLRGAQHLFKVTPDVATFSKCMANGFPISAVVGRAKIMEHFALGKAFWSTTYGNESLSMGVSLETIKFLEEREVIPFLWKQGDKLMKGFNELSKRYRLEKYLQCIGAGPRNVQIFKNYQGKPDLIVKTLFQQECVKRGLITLGCHNVCFSHSNAIVKKILAIYDEVLSFFGEVYQRGDDPSKYLVGPSAEPVFRRF